MSVRSKDLRPYLSTSEYRALSTWHLKAVKLRKEHSASWRALGELFGVSHTVVKKAYDAVERGRTPGLRGRPTLLTEEEEEAVLCLRQEAEMRGDTPSPADLIRLVLCCADRCANAG